METPTVPHDHGQDLAYGFPTVFGRGLLDEFRNFVNPPFLVVTMEDSGPCSVITSRAPTAVPTAAGRSSRTPS